jgi:hypothetical protein
MRYFEFFNYNFEEMDDWKNTVFCVKKYWKNPITGGLNYV